MMDAELDCLTEVAETALRPWPHVVILGAGASRAATPHAEASGRVLPLTEELPDELALDDLLDSELMSEARADFEGFFSRLYREGDQHLLSKIESRTFDYFDSVALRESVTLYDRLILSLRRKDMIATFNWDPLLAYAYRRSGTLGSLPSLAFLHGNVRLGVCHQDQRFGWNDDSCLVCGEAMEPVSLLYPVENKDYSSDVGIAQQWDLLKWHLEATYFLTIFGWSAPPTDIDARDRIVGALAQNAMTRLLQVEIIDPRAEELRRGNLAPIVSGEVHSHTGSRLDHSWLTAHPRLSCEALYEATMQQSPITSCPLPNTDSLQ